MEPTISASNNSEGNFPPKPSFNEPSLINKGFIEGDHQLEKLEFALALAETQGDQFKSNALRAQIDALGGNYEEPGT